MSNDGQECQIQIGKVHLLLPSHQLRPCLLMQLRDTCVQHAPINPVSLLAGACRQTAASEPRRAVCEGYGPYIAAWPLAQPCKAATLHAGKRHVRAWQHVRGTCGVGPLRVVVLAHEGVGVNEE